MTNPHDEQTGYQIDPSVLAVHSESDVTRLHGDADETERVQDAFGALAPVEPGDAESDQ